MNAPDYEPLISFCCPFAHRPPFFLSKNKNKGCRRSNLYIGWQIYKKKNNFFLKIHAYLHRHTRNATLFFFIFCR
jgi:hypothetical protein